MATDIERLSVLIEANTKSYERSMLKLQQQTDKAIRGASKSISSLDGALTKATSTARGFATAFGAGLIAGGIATLPSLIRETVKSVADLGDTADKIGLTTDALQELEFAARQSGIGTEELDTALTKFSRGLGQAAAGGGDLFKVFQANGVAIKDASGNLLPFTTLLSKYADLIKNAPSDQARLNLALLAFGKGGANLVNLTRDGAAGLAELQQQARDAGAVIDADLVKSARLLDDELQALTDRFQVLVKSEILEFLQRLAATMDVLRDATAFAADKFETLAAAAGFLQGVQLPEWLQIVKQSAGNVIDPLGAATKAIETLTNAAKEAFPLSPDARIDQAFRDAGSRGPIPRITIHPQPLTATPRPGGTGGGTSDLERQKKAVTDLIAELQREQSLVGATDAQKRISNELRRAGAAATQQQKDQITALVTNIEAEEQAQQRLIDTLDEIRNASGSALDAFAQSIQDGEGVTAGLKAALVDLLQTIIRIGEQKAILSLFGAFGTPGGGLLSGILGGIFGASTAASAPLSTPSIPHQQPLVLHIVEAPGFAARVEGISGAQVVRHTSGIESRAIARGPAVARDNQRRFGTP